MTDVSLIKVFVRGIEGGNPVPLVADAAGMSSEEMRDIARRFGHESSFVLPATRPDCDYRLRFFVPKHEMEMCGHATVGTMWALRQWGLWNQDSAWVETLSGRVQVMWEASTSRVWISQPAVNVDALNVDQVQEVVKVLGLPPGATISSVVNASTSRVKTLIRLGDSTTLNALQPDFASIEEVCEAIGSTGLYPYARVSASRWSARQFPKASGYPEDAATGIAAAALWGYLAETGALELSSVCSVLQGDAMGSPSLIEVKARNNEAGASGCWLSGEVVWANAPSSVGHSS